MRYALFIGRWQPFHNGHRWLINQQLKKEKSVCIAIMDIKPDGEKNLWYAKEIKRRLEKEYKNNKNIKIIIIPPIESVNYGRDVGYEIIEWKPPEDIKKISATEIRKKIKQKENKKNENINNNASL